jgi:glycosyltransferase involved in cell wall biosynthesis
LAGTASKHVVEDALIDSRRPFGAGHPQEISSPRPPGRATANENRKLLVIDTAYTLEAIRERQLEHSVTCRDLDGFFDHVWSIHPFATLLTSDAWGPRYGKPSTYEIASRHTFIEGKVGRFDVLKRLFTANFILGQAGLFLHLLKLIRREHIDVIRTGSPLYIGVLGWALARISGIPVVVRVGGNHDKYFQTTGQPVEPRLMRSRRIEKVVERFVFRRADLVAGANQDNLDFALANGARRERSTLFRYGNLVDGRHFADPSERQPDESALRRLGLNTNMFLLYVGRLERIKQADHVVRVLADVGERGFDVKAVLAGEGRMRDELKQLARELGVENRLILAGNVDQQLLAALYPAAAVVVSPHTGRALTEAALSGAPVVAYDVDWQGELIETGKTGFLVPHSDVKAMSKAVACLLGDTFLAKSLGRALRKRALEMFDPGTLNEHERQEYRKLLERFAK